VLLHCAELLHYSVTKSVTTLCRGLLCYMFTEWLYYSVIEQMCYCIVQRVMVLLSGFVTV